MALFSVDGSVLYKDVVRHKDSVAMALCKAITLVARDFADLDLDSHSDSDSVSDSDSNSDSAPDDVLR